MQTSVLPILFSTLLFVSSPPQAKSIDAASLYTREQLSQSFTPCLNQFPNQNPNQVTSVFNADWQPTQLCSDNFAVLYSKKTKTPLVVVEHLNAAIINDAKGEERTNEFYADPRLKQNDSAQLTDYKGSGFDRGHNAPAGDAPTPHAMAQTFALSNMIPQNQENNRQVWSKVEGNTRQYILRSSSDVFVYTGPLFTGNKVNTIGSSQVWVPTHIFKLVYVPNENKSWAFVLPNTSDAQVTKPMSYEDFVKATGLALLDGKISPNAAIESATSKPITNSNQSSFTCGNKSTCKEMSGCAEAKFYLQQCGLTRLDGDHDGIPCEKLCR